MGESIPLRKHKHHPIIEKTVTFEKIENGKLTGFDSKTAERKSFKTSLISGLLAINSLCCSMS